LDPSEPSHRSGWTSDSGPGQAQTFFGTTNGAGSQYTLAGRARLRGTATFTPTVRGPLNQTLQLLTSDPRLPEVEVQLLGNGK